MEVNEIISSGLLELYVLGMATEQETAHVLAMAKQYPEVAAELASIEQGLERYAASNAVPPSPSVKQKILSQINTSADKERTLAPVVSISPFWKYAAAASIILLIGSIVLNVVHYNKYRDANQQLTAANKERSAVEQQFFALQQENSEMKNDMNVVQSKYSEPVALRGLPAAPDAAAKIFWMKNTGEVYIDPSNLPDAPAGKQYQLWGIVDGKPVDGGMIVTTNKNNKYRIQKMKSFGKAQAFAVTLETTGGNPTPKGDMYVMGKM